MLNLPQRESAPGLLANLDELPLKEVRLADGDEHRDALVALVRAPLGGRLDGQAFADVGRRPAEIHDAENVSDAFADSALGEIAVFRIDIHGGRRAVPFPIVNIEKWSAVSYSGLTPSARPAFCGGMANLVTLKVDVRKLDKSRFFEGKPDKDGHKPLYADLVLIPRRELGNYGDTHLVKQSKKKDEQVELPIIGNATERAGPPQQQPGSRQPTRPAAPPSPPPDLDEDVPF